MKTGITAAVGQRQELFNKNDKPKKPVLEALALCCASLKIYHEDVVVRQDPLYISPPDIHSQVLLITAYPEPESLAGRVGAIMLFPSVKDTELISQLKQTFLLSWPL